MLTIAYSRGAWHVISVLSQLVSLFSEDTDQYMLRAGQLEWIQGQLLRTMRLLNLDQHQIKVQPSSNPGTPDNCQNVALTEKARDFAEKIRSGLRLMSGS